jgi:hypothetical protein
LKIKERLCSVVPTLEKSKERLFTEDREVPEDQDNEVQGRKGQQDRPGHLGRQDRRDLRGRDQAFLGSGEEGEQDGRGCQLRSCSGNGPS